MRATFATCAGPLLATIGALWMALPASGEIQPPAVIANSGHWPMEEQPSATASVILTSLKNN